MLARSSQTATGSAASSRTTTNRATIGREARDASRSASGKAFFMSTRSDARPDYGPSVPQYRLVWRTAHARLSICGKPLRDVLRDGERRGQAGRFDAEEVDEAGHAVRLGSLDHEVARRLVRRLDLRADTRVIRVQGVVGQVGPVAADRGIEQLGAAGVDIVVDLFHPLRVGSEPAASRQVARIVQADAGVIRRRIDQPRERWPRGEREVAALGIVQRRDGVGWQAADRTRDALSAEAGAIA